MMKSVIKILLLVLFGSLILCVGATASIKDSWTTDDGHTRTISVSSDPFRPSCGDNFSRANFSVRDERGPISGVVITFPANAPIATRLFHKMTATNAEGRFTVDYRVGLPTLGDSAVSIRVLVDGVERLFWIQPVSEIFPKMNTIWAGTVSGTATETGGSGFAATQAGMAVGNTVSAGTTINSSGGQGINCTAEGWSGGADAEDDSPGSVGGAMSSVLSIMATDAVYGPYDVVVYNPPSKLFAYKEVRPDISTAAFISGEGSGSSTLTLSTTIDPKVPHKLTSVGTIAGEATHIRDLILTKLEPVDGKVKGSAIGFNISTAAMGSVPGGRGPESSYSASAGANANAYFNFFRYSVAEVP